MPNEQLSDDVEIWKPECEASIKPKRYPRRKGDLKAMLEDRYIKQDDDGCWNFMAALDGSGYGKLHIGKRIYRQAHRISYEIHNGPIPNGMLVRHKCDNPRCVNPSHLEVGTSSQNVMDSVVRGGHAQARKTHCPNGHEYTADNTYRRLGNGHRQCRACRRKQ